MSPRPASDPVDDAPLPGRVDASGRADATHASLPARAARMNSPLGRTSALGSIDPGDVGLPRDATKALDLAQNRDDVVAAVTAALQPAARGVGVLVLRKHVLEGWRCNTGLADPVRFRALRIPDHPPSILSMAVAGGSYCGRVPPGASHEALRATLTEPDSDVSVAAVRIADRCAMLILCSGIDNATDAPQRLARTAHEAGEALTRILASEKRSR
jgi:hypothetical protein